MVFFEKEKIRTKANEKILLKDFLKKPEVKFESVLEYTKIDLDLTDEEKRFIESEIKYEGYFKRQREQVERFRRMEERRIPKSIDYHAIHALSKEAREKLSQIQPLSLGQVARISGVSPADISVLTLFIEKGLADRSVPRGTD